MKINAIVLHNHLSHVDTTVEFNGTRLAAFVGANGAGKSALLEALKYVLFDSARAKTDQLVRLGETDMSATVEFDFAGAAYRAIRGRSTKGAGKTYLELHVKALDGSWTALTGDDIRQTQANIGRLLGLDADTFATAVFLGQGDADRFAEATASERKRILSTVLGLDVYARAEGRAREEARDLEARTVSERSHLERLDDAIAELERAPGMLEEAQGAVHDAESALASHRETRVRVTGDIADLAEQLTKVVAARADVDRLEAERTGLADRYRAARERMRAAESAIADAELTLADSEAVDVAVGEEPAARALVAKLDAEADEDRRLAEEIRPKRQAVDHDERAYHEALASWNASLAAGRALATSLEAQGKALEPVICEKCQHPNVVDQADIRGQLTTARIRVHELEATEPVEPKGLSFERAKVIRLEERRRELAWDPSPLAAARTALEAIAKTASRFEAIGLARIAVGREQTTRDTAAAELATITATGEALTERILTARLVMAEGEPIEAERSRLAQLLVDVDANITATDERRTSAITRQATAEANVARLQQLQGERTAVAAGLVATDADLALLRRLVAAFGVTGIPARIIEGVLPELASYANELLGELRPGMVLEIRAQREKKGGKGVVEALDLIVQDDVGERPLALFSGGERMSVSLAIAVALSRLVARRAGARIESLVIDEPDGLDGDARRAFGQALRVIAHRGDLARVVLVSHHPDLAEYADEVWNVSKNGHGSVVEPAA